MSEHLDIPPELQHLIEKREEDDRRLNIRRKSDQVTESNGEETPSSPNVVQASSDDPIDQMPDLRELDDRRQHIRRASEQID